MKILVVEDHPKIRENIIHYLEVSGFVSEGAIHGQEALEKTALGNYDLIILDSNLPLLSGEEFLKLFRKKDAKTPILSLTSNSMLEDKLSMFEKGVDDYMTKPFELAELVARIKVLLKRGEKILHEEKILGDIKISLTQHKVFLKNREIELSNKEYLIVEFLALHQGFPQSKTQILEKVWGESEENLPLSSTTLEAHISTLRKKLGKNFIKTQIGVGYIIE